MPTPSSPSFTSASVSSSISSGGTAQPFTEVTLIDPGTNAMETLTVSVTAGTLSGTGFTPQGTGTYVATGTVAQINADLAAATFTDTFPTSTDTYIKTDYLTLRDIGSVNGVSSTGSASLTGMVDVKPQLVAEPQPRFTSTQPTVTLVSGQTDHALAGVTLSDTNPSGYIPSETLTAVTSGGTFSGAGFVHTTGGTYVATGTTAQINTDLAVANFTDTRTSGTATDTISLSDAATIAAVSGVSVEPALTTVTVDVTQPAPSDPSFTTSSSAISSIPSGGTTHPFSKVTLADPGIDATETLTVSITGGTLSGTGFTNTAAGTYVAMGTVAQINADLAGATFTDTFFTSGDLPSKPDIVQLRDTGSANGISSTGSAFLAGVVNVQADYVPDPVPSFMSTQPTVTLVSGQTDHVLAGVTLSDPSSSGLVPSETLTVTVSGGTFSGTGFAHASADTYVATGTAAQINTDLAAATFTDTRLLGTGGATDSLKLSDTATIAATGGVSTSPAVTTVNVDVTQPASSSHPVFTPSGLLFGLVPPGGTIAPFTGATLSDTDKNAVETATVVAQSGTFSGSGFTQTTTGTFVASGTVAQINADLAGARFTDTALSPVVHDIKGDLITVTDTGSVGGVVSAAATLAVEVDFMTQYVAPSSPVLTDPFPIQHYPAGTGKIVGIIDTLKLSDSGYQPAETLTAVVSGGGAFSGPGFTQTATGTFVATGGVAQINEDLQGATLTASGAGTTTILVSDTGSVLGVSSLATATITEIVVVAPCFATGTMIRTEAGEVAVEALKVGDRVLMASGGLRPIRWLGHRRVNCRRHPEPEKVRPVRVRAHAFGDNLPARDLVLSPEHALFLDGHLVPVHALLDGVSLVQEAWERVTYHHVELDRHDVLLAEGLAAESYLDTGNRDQFANAPVAALHPEFEVGGEAAEACAPILLAGARLEALRAGLAARRAMSSVA